MTGWLVLIVLVLVLIATLWYRYVHVRDPARPGLPGRLSPRREFAQNRDRGGSNDLSEADRIWEAETQERERQTRERFDPDPDT
jgi:hypothetical protein